MMLKLILRNMLQHPWRTFLTTGSVFFAVFLVCALQAAISSLTAAVDAASSQRLWMQSAVSLFVDLPQSYEQKLKNIDGVDYVSKWQWFGGYYKEESNFFAQFGVDSATFLKSYPELSVVEGSYEAFEKNRTGCIIGRDIADKYGFKIGDNVPIIGTIFARADGSAWQFKVEGIYETSVPAIDQNTMYFHFDYIREAVEGGAVRGFDEMGVGVYMLRPKEDADPVRLMAAADLLFKDGPQRTQTTTEAEFSRQFISMLGNVPLLLRSVGGGVLFAIFFAVLNTMMMAGQERTRDIGVMKALGFRNSWVSRLLIIESLVICAVGGALGIGIAKFAESKIQGFASAIFPGFEIGTSTLILGVTLALGIGFFAGLFPSLRALRLTPIAALRQEG